MKQLNFEMDFYWKRPILKEKVLNKTNFEKKKTTKKQIEKISNETLLKRKLVFVKINNKIIELQLDIGSDITRCLQ